MITPSFSIKAITRIEPWHLGHVNGNADLLKETLDFRVEPKIVGTIKGQGDVKQRSGIMVPVLVTGNFSSPKFRPDLESIAKQQFQEKVILT